MHKPNAPGTQSFAVLEGMLEQCRMLEQRGFLRGWAGPANDALLDVDPEETSGEAAVAHLYIRLAELAVNPTAPVPAPTRDGPVWVAYRAAKMRRSTI